MRGAIVALFLVAACASGGRDSETVCAEHGLAADTAQYAACVETVRDHGSWILGHSHAGGHR